LKGSVFGKILLNEICYQQEPTKGTSWLQITSLELLTMKIRLHILAPGMPNEKISKQFNPLLDHIGSEETY
jgi:hypothetical protein